MHDTNEVEAVLRREARRCERLAQGLTDPATIAELLAWAAEYERGADELARVLVGIEPHPSLAA